MLEMLATLRSVVIRSSSRSDRLTIGLRCLQNTRSNRQSSNNAQDPTITLGEGDSGEGALATEQTVYKLDKSRVPVLNEDDLDEKFISGSGPGGQKVNKATNCCQLRHRPSGIIVKVHQSRALSENRKIARELLTQKLDDLYNGDQSVRNQSKRLALKRMSLRESQSRTRRAMKEELKKTLDEEKKQRSTPSDETG